MQVPAGATRVPATTSLDGAVSQEVFVSGAQSANGGATVAVTSYEMTCDLELRLDVPASQLGLGSAGRTQFKAGVASAAGVAPNQVVVNTVSDARRRLQTGRALVDYTITAPVDVSDAVSSAGYSQALVVRSRSHFPFFCLQLSLTLWSLNAAGRNQLGRYSLGHLDGIRRAVARRAGHHHHHRV